MLLPDTTAHLGAVRATAVSADGALVATGGADRSIRIWSGQTGRLLRRWHPPLGEGQVGSIDALDFSPDAALLFVTAVDWVSAPRGIIYVFDVATGAIRRAIGSRPSNAWRYPGLAVSPRGGVVALATELEGLAVLRYDADLAVKIGFASAADPSNPMVAVAFSPDGGSIATLLQKNLLRLYPVTEEARLQAASLESRLPGRPVSLAFSAAGDRIAIGFSDRRSVAVLDQKSSRLNLIEPPPEFGPGNLALVAWGTGGDGAEWLFAGGTMERAGGGNLLLAWQGGQAGHPLSALVAHDSLASLSRHPAGGVVFGSTDASWGRVAVGRAAMRLTVDASRSERLDFRETERLRWKVDESGEAVEFQAGTGQPPLRFDLAQLKLSEASPRTASHRPGPGLARLPPDLERRGERVRSSDVAPGTGQIVIGTQETLVLLDAKGAELARRLLATPAWAVGFAGNGRIIVAAHGDGTLRWYGLASGALLHELGGVFVEQDRRKWVAWRNDGRFAYSDLGGETLVGLHENGRYDSSDPAALTSRWMTIDQHYRQLYDPAAVSGMARPGAHWAEAGQNVAPALKAAAADTAPTIRVLQICGSDDVSERARRSRLLATLDSQPDPPAPAACHDLQRALPGGSGAVEVDPATQAVRVRLDVSASFSPVMVDAFVNGINAGRAFHKPGAQAEQIVFLPSKEARIEFRAYGAANSFNRTAPVVVTRRLTAPGEPAAATAPATTPGTLRVLAAGIDRYTGTIPALRYAVSDASTFATTIAQVLPRAYDALATPIVLRDEAATRDAVRNALMDIALRAERDDAVLIYLSGHGVSVRGDYAFVTANVTDANGALDRGEGCLPADDIVGLLSNIRAARTLLMLDTCFANAIDLQVGGRLGHETGRYVLTASGSDEEALDGYDDVNGVFGHAVKEGLTGLAPASGGVLDALELCRYVRDRVGTLAAQRRHSQRAHFQAAGELIAFPVAQPHA
ncbi:MAG: caspase family protein [Acetobacteraceae bacterium]|nr:caspase family protein [Acetobacteraceae bacterium]